MGTQLPSIEILMFSYNQEAFIDEAIESVFQQQTRFPTSLRIHDDRSTDSTFERAVNALRGAPIPARAYQPAANRYSQGMSFFAEEILATRADYIALIDGDDVWTATDKLERQIELMERWDQVALCHHPFGHIRSSEIDVSDWRPEALRGYHGPGSALARMNFIGASTVVLRTAALPARMPDGFDALKIGDYPLWSLVTDGWDIAEVPESMSLYRQHESNVYDSISAIEKFNRELQARAFCATHVIDASRPAWLEGIREFVETHAQVPQLRDRIDILERSQRQLQSDLSTAAGELGDRETELASMRASRSWRLTRPLRSVAHRINQGRSK